jgi:hypothetical protein
MEMIQLFALAGSATILTEGGRLVELAQHHARGKLLFWAVLKLLVLIVQCVVYIP